MNNKGFTLTELMAVVIILIIVLTLTIPNIVPFITETTEKSLAKDIEIFKREIILQLDNCYNFSASSTLDFSKSVAEIEFDCGIDMNIKDPAKSDEQEAPYYLDDADIIEINSSNTNDILITDLTLNYYL